MDESTILLILGAWVQVPPESQKYFLSSVGLEQHPYKVRVIGSTLIGSTKKLYEVFGNMKNKL